MNHDEPAIFSPRIDAWIDTGFAVVLLVALGWLLGMVIWR